MIRPEPLSISLDAYSQCTQMCKYGAKETHTSALCFANSVPISDVGLRRVWDSDRRCTSPRAMSHVFEYANSRFCALMSSGSTP